MIERIFKKRIKKIKDKFNELETILESNNVNFFGQQSKGYHQVRGNGVLILTKDKLYFEMWKPKKVFEISINSIQGLEITRSFLGKSRFRDLLKINFINDKKESDSAAWFVFDLRKWYDGINELI